MLNFNQTVQAEFLQARYLILELAAVLDRLDEAAARSGCSSSDNATVRHLSDAIKTLASPSPTPDRAERLLRHYAGPEL